MRLVQWTDDKGYYRLSYVRDDDPDELAPQGIPCDMPDVESLDWKGIAREVHNELVRQRLLSWDDVKEAQRGITNIVNTTIRRKLIVLYRTHDGG